jgi:hypothetical protein
VIAASDALSNIAFIIDNLFRHKAVTYYTKPLGAAADTVRDSFDLYEKYHTFSAETLAFSLSKLCHTIASIALSMLTFYSLYEGRENPAPLTTILAVSIYLGTKISAYIYSPPAAR